MFFFVAGWYFPYFRGGSRIPPTSTCQWLAYSPNIPKNLRLKWFQFNKNSKEKYQETQYNMYIYIYIYTCNVYVTGTYTPVGFKLDLLCTRFWYCKISVNISQQSVPTGASSHADHLPQPGHCGPTTVTSLNLRQGQIIETNKDIYVYIYIYIRIHTWNKLLIWQWFTMYGPISKKWIIKSWFHRREGWHPYFFVKAY